MTIDGLNLGNLPEYLFVFTNGSIDANWQGASKGYIGNVAVNGLVASERTSGYVPYAGTIYTNAPTLGAWQQIVDENPTQATGSTNEVARLTGLQNNLISAFQQINALPPTPGFENRSVASLDGLNTQNGINETFVINITSGFNFSNKINITGDAGDVYIFRWDEDANPFNGYQGQVKPQSGGAFVPHGGLTPTNFINVAGDINSSGGGTNPLPPYPQGPRYDNGLGPLIIGGNDFNGGGFFTGYWLTTGAPTNFDSTTGLFYGSTAPLSNGIFVGGWYTITNKFSMTSGTSGVYVSPNPETVETPSVMITKYVSPDNGVTWFDANTPPGPFVLIGTNPMFKYVVTNNGNTTLTNVQVTDDVFGPIVTIPSLAPGEVSTTIITGTWAEGTHLNTATVTANADGIILTATDVAYFTGVTAAIRVIKQVSPDNGITWFDADTPPGPNIMAGTNPLFRYIVTNIGAQTLTGVTLTDDKLGVLSTGGTLAPGASFEVTASGTWAAGQQVNIATATGTFDGLTVTDTNPAYYVGVENAAIQVIKQVSPDNGITWFDADTPPGPNIMIGTNPLFKYIVTNIGTVTLTNVTLTDNKLGVLSLGGVLAPGASFEVGATGTWASGQQENIATATGTFDGLTVISTNPAYYVGIENIGISIRKLVSVDNGATFIEANTPPGPELPAGVNPQFKYIVTNTGTVTLTNVVITDNVYGNIANIPTLAPGASQEFIIIG